ncbi:MAG TPA: DUF1080 domain-containing protein, partial [Planctomycetota bacterium]|nr:DUF1080 domain-containing protein [Planctomycetota bacterium]
MPARVAFATALAVFPGALTAQQSQAAGLQPLCNGKDLAGWHGQREFDPAKWAALPVAERTRFLADDAAAAAQHWQVVDGALVNDGQGPYLTTDREFGDAEYRLEYRTVAKADSGIYLRATPQVQIWDCTEAGGKWGSGADKGSGGLWNNEQHLRWPLVRADRPFGEWNTLRIEQLGERTWVWFNDQLTVDGVVMENYWDRKRPHFPRGPLQLQTHGGEIRFRNLQARDIPPAEANARL